MHSITVPSPGFQLFGNFGVVLPHHEIGLSREDLSALAGPAVDPPGRSRSTDRQTATRLESHVSEFSFRVAGVGRRTWEEYESESVLVFLTQNPGTAQLWISYGE